MIKFKSESPEPYHITSRELASMLDMTKAITSLNERIYKLEENKNNDTE